MRGFFIGSIVYYYLYGNNILTDSITFTDTKKS